MQHLGFIFFVLLVAMLIFYAMVLYGVPKSYNLGLGFNQTGTSTVQTVQRQPTTQQLGAGNRIISQANPPQTGYNTSGYSPNADVSHPTTPTYYGRVTINPSDIPPGFSIRDISPYFKQIMLSASPGAPGMYSQITLTSSLLTTGGSLNVTGWLLKGNRGSQYVPQAVDVYNPSGLTPESDIYMKNGDTLNIYSNSSALAVNFRSNKCIGYLSNGRNFVPPLYFGCPVINRSEIINFTGQCQNYITSLNSCQSPAPNPPISIYDYSCRAYLDKLNYAGCFQKHGSDYDFLGSQRYAWSGTQFLDSQHDRLLLFDRSGLLVSEYTY